MPNKEPNSWAVMYRDPKDTEWTTATWYPAINISLADSKRLPYEQQFDLGEARASREARVILINSDWHYEVTVKFVYHSAFAENHGKIWTYIGEQK